MKTRIILLFTLLLMVNIALIAQTPDWQWATQAGGSGSDVGNGITIDDTGNSYVTGFFKETATFGSYSLTSSGIADIFVAKIDIGGNWLWATKAGGSGWDCGWGITIDDAGNSYVTGNFTSTATFGSYSLYSSGVEDIFVAKMDANGNWLWATQAGGSGSDGGNGITIDDAGNSYVTGYFKETATFGSYSLTSSGDRDIFVSKMDADGNWLWATQAGGSGDGDRGCGIIIDDAVNCYVTGPFDGTATFGSYSLTSSGGQDIFVAKIDANGNWLWVTKAGGSNNDIGSAITIDDAVNCYVTGNFKETATFGSYTITNSGCFDIFVAKMDANGNWQWATKAGGTSYDYGNGITIDNAGNYYVTGCFEGIATFGFYFLTSSGGYDIFVAKLNSTLSAENEISPTINSLSNYPNPFNPSTTISFSIPEESKVELTIFNIKGQKVKILVKDEFEKGDHFVIWNGIDENNKSVSSGIYLYKLNVNGKTEAVKKCILLK